MNTERITLAHGSGGSLMRGLIKGLFVKELKNPFLSGLDDAAALSIKEKNLLFTTDGYVVSPLFFPGGDIGKLSIYGTVNDLAVCGARPLYISAGMIAEEGLGMDVLRKVVRSMKEALRRAKVFLVTGDIKVVEKGKCDKLFITTSGVGVKIKDAKLSLDRVRKGDRIIVSGPVGQHGACILASREGFALASDIRSDCAPLGDLVSRVLGACGGVKFMRDPTRGGLASVLNEFVDRRGFGIVIDEEEIPVSNGVRSVCELLGFDPLYMANEGRVVMIVSQKDSSKVLRALKGHPQGRLARIIGEAVSRYNGKVCLKTRAGGLRLIRMLTGEQLPRIC